MGDGEIMDVSIAGRFLCNLNVHVEFLGDEDIYVAEFVVYNSLMQ